MSDNYQATYDAVRSRISNCNIGEILSEVLQESFDISHAASSCFQSIAQEHCAPSVLYRPTLTLDGNLWCAFYGADPQVGVSGFGDSPAAAMAAFDAVWFTKHNQPTQPT